MHKYKYFISFSHAKGFGNLEYGCDKKIEKYEDIEEIQNKLKNKHNDEGVIVLYYTLLKTN